VSEQMIAAVGKLSNALCSHLATVANAAKAGGPAAAHAELCPYRRAQGRAHPDDPIPNGEWAALLSAAAGRIRSAHMKHRRGVRTFPPTRRRRSSNLVTENEFIDMCKEVHSIDYNFLLMDFAPKQEASQEREF